MVNKVTPMVKYYKRFTRAGVFWHRTTLFIYKVYEDRHFESYNRDKAMWVPYLTDWDTFKRHHGHNGQPYEISKEEAFLEIL